MPGQYWDTHKTVALTNVDLPYLLGFRTTAAQFIVGMLAAGFLFGWWVPLVPLLGRKKQPAALMNLSIYRWLHGFYNQLGGVRFTVVASLFALMMSLPAKMVLRWDPQREVHLGRSPAVGRGLALVQYLTI